MVNKKKMNKLVKVFENNTRIISWLLLVGSLLILLLSSVYVGYKSGYIQTNNHDNLVDNYMLESSETFKESLFPAAHTFLFKWPLFALSSSFGNNISTYVLTTVFVYLATIVGFLLVIFLLSKRNILITAFSSLALAAVLMLIPAQPVDGTLLPLNMAMITTRNLEFLLFFAFIYFAITAKKILSWQTILAIFTLTILGASDKFYLMIALFASIVYIAFLFSPLSNLPKDSKKTSMIPFLVSILSYILANVLLILLNKYEVTGIPEPTNTAPFAIVESAWKLMEAIAGAVQGTMANFGANVFNKSLGLSLLPYLVNGTLLVAAVYFSYRIYLRKNASPNVAKDSVIIYKFTLWLLLAYAGSFVLFIASNHAYLLDGRYLTITTFTGIAIITVYLSNLNLKHKDFWIIVACGTLIALMPLYAAVTHRNYKNAINSTQDAIGTRTDKAAEILKQHNVTVFVGDYWFVSPTRLRVGSNLTPVLMSTDNCDTPNYFLTSKIWYRPDDSVERSALYILRDSGENATTFNHGCSIEFLNNRYGEPVHEYIIREDDGLPIDVIRIYDYDIRTKIPQQP